MATRPIFISCFDYPYSLVKNVSFKWFSGLCLSQKQKSIESLHSSFNTQYPGVRLLEVSSKSKDEIGRKLSAFNLKKYVPSLNKYVSIESIFQGSKVFEDGGPYLDLLDVSSKQAKQDNRLNSKLIKFNFEGKDYPINPKTIFYDYIYMNALLENDYLIDEVIKFDGFTDIEFNPSRSINCQAKALSEFVSLYRLNLLDKIKDFNQFYLLFQK